MIFHPANVKNPTLMVCIPVYNHEKFIDEAVLSVINQGIPDIYILIAEDGSTDSSYTQSKRLQQKYPYNIAIIHHEKNVGLNKNIVSIYANIPETIRYISWFSGDDLMLPNKLLKQIAFLEQKPNIVMCYHDTIVRDEVKNIEYRYNSLLYGQKPYQGDIADALIEHGCFVSGLSALIRYEKTKNITHNSDFGISNDWAYFIDLAIEGDVGYLDEVLGVYRRHKTNITRTSFDLQEPITILHHLKGKHPNRSESVNRGLIRQHSAIAWKLILSRNPKAIQEFRNALDIIFSDFYLSSSFIRHNIMFIIKRMIFLTKTGSLLR